MHAKQHVECPIEVLKKYRNYLDSDGKIYIAVPNAEALNRRLGNIAGLLPDINMLSDFDISSGHKRFYTVESLIAEANQSGFDIVTMEGIYLKPFTTEQIISLNLDEKIIDAMCKIGIQYPELCLGLLAELKEFKEL